MLIDILLLPQWLSQDPEFGLLWCKLYLDVRDAVPLADLLQQGDVSGHLSLFCALATKERR
jgi:hypothetical protein